MSTRSEIARKAARRAWKTRLSPQYKSRASEAASKQAFKDHCEKRGWRVAFFESESGAPRTGIIDAIAFGLDRKNADGLVVWLIQLKGGKAGVSGGEMNRLKKAVGFAKTDWAIAAFDGEELTIVPDFTKSS